MRLNKPEAESVESGSRGGGSCRVVQRRWWESLKNCLAGQLSENPTPENPTLSSELYFGT